MGYKATVLADSPFTYLRLNETSGTVAADSSGNGHNGTYSGGVTLNQPGAVTEAGARAAKLDGSTGFISLPSTGVPTGNAAFTQELWALINAAAGTSVFMGWGTNTTNEEPVFYFDASRNLFISTWNTDTNIATLLAGAWYHLVATYDGTTHKGYVNGQLAGSHTPGVVATPLTPAWTIGQNPSPSEFFASITVQEAAGYATALSAARVLAHYQAGIQLFGQPSLIGGRRSRVHGPSIIRGIDPLVTIG